MTTYIVGRAPSRDGLHVVISDPTVSRNHCTITERGGRYVVEDLGSTSGSFLREADGWHPIEAPTPVTVSAELRLGSHETRIATLIAHAVPSPLSKQGGRVTYERNPETGEIVKRYRP